MLYRNIAERGGPWLCADSLRAAITAGAHRGRLPVGLPIGAFFIGAIHGIAPQIAPQIGAILEIALITDANAASRCGTKLVNPGDKLADVLQSCGSPVAQASDGPVIRNNGVPRKGSQKTDVVVYGPNGGAYQYMLFINDELVRVDLRRDAPAGNILRW